MEYAELDALINALEQDVQRAKARSGVSWKEIWSSIRTIGAGFKGIKYPTEADRNAAWAPFRKIVGDVEAHRDEQEKAWKDQSSLSEGIKSQILRYAELAGRDDPITAGAKGMIGALSLGILDESEKENLDSRSRNLKKAWDRFEERKGDLLGLHKREIFEALQQVNEKLNSDWAAFKEASAQSRKRVSEEGRKAFEERINANIAKLDNRLRRLYEILERKEEHLQELYDKRDSARKAEFRAVVEGWIEKEQTEIARTQAEIKQVEEWREEERRKLR